MNIDRPASVVGASPCMTDRAFASHADFWRIRQLCINTFSITGLGWNWELRHWDGNRFYAADPVLNPDWARGIHLWETPEGQLAGAVNDEGGGLFYLQLDPEYREAVEEPMIAWAEDHLAVPLAGSAQRLAQMEVFEYDTIRQRMLTRRGYIKQPEGGVIRRMYLPRKLLPEVRLYDGYTLRTIHGKDMADCQRLADLLNAAFHRSFHNAGEFYQFARLAPCYCEDLHLVAEAPDGSFAAHVAVIYDEANRRGLFEPVCTHPDHQRKGLAYDLMREGLRRLQALEARQVTVETGDMIPANALYDAMGFTEAYKSYLWKKIF